MDKIEQDEEKSRQEPGMEEKSPSRRQVDSRRLLSIVGLDCGMGMKGPAARGQRSTLNKRTETKTWRDKISCEKSRRTQKDKLVGPAPAVVRRLSAQTVHSATTTGARMAGHAIICMGGTTTMQGTNGTNVSTGVRFLARMLLIVRAEQVL